MPNPRTPKQSPESRKAGSAEDRHSPVTENYLLSLYKLWEDSEVPTVTQLTDNLKQLPPTEGLGTSVPSVSGMVRRMEKQGLVEIGSDKRIRLTRRGVEGGEDIARRHRLAEWLVVRLLGMDLHRAYVEAHQLEHGMSRDLETRLMECLGYPKKSPFGRPIPGTEDFKAAIDLGYEPPSDFYSWGACFEYKYNSQNTPIPEGVRTTWQRYNNTAAIFDEHVREGPLWMRKLLAKVAGWRLRRGEYRFPLEQKLFDVYVRATGQTQPGADLRPIPMIDA